MTLEYPEQVAEELPPSPASAGPADIESPRCAASAPINAASKRKRTVLWLAVALLLGCQIVACVAGAKPSLAGNVDLRAFYAAGTIIRTGHAARLYDYEYERTVQDAVAGPRPAALPFLYPSFSALPFVPISLLKYRAAFVFMVGFNLLLMVAASLLLRPRLPYFRDRSRWLLPAIWGCLFGVSIALMQGQISFALLLVYCSAWTLMKREQDVLAGMVLALALAKFQIVLPVVLLFCLWRQWRVISGFAIGSVAVAGVSLATVGFAGAAQYLQGMAGMTRQTAFHVAEAKARYGMSPHDMPNLHGLTFGLSHGTAWGLALNGLLSVAVMAFAARQRRSLLVALPAAMLVSYHMQPHDLTLLLLPLSFTLARLLSRPEGAALVDGAGEWMFLASLTLLVLPFAAVAMGLGANYMVSLAVMGVLWHAARFTEA